MICDFPIFEFTPWGPNDRPALDGDGCCGSSSVLLHMHQYSRLPF